MDPKLIVAIRSPLQMDDRRAAIRDTWGKDFIDQGAEVLFVVSGDTFVNKQIKRQDDLLYTPGTNTHRDLTNRMVWLWKFLMTQDFTHALVMDDDCSVNVPLFMSLSWKDVDAWGHNNGGYLSGCAAVYSRTIIDKLNQNMAKDDIVIGALLSKWNTELTQSGRPSNIKPWSPTNDKWSFGDPDVAIQHYVRKPAEIIEHHTLLKKINKL